MKIRNQANLASDPEDRSNAGNPLKAFDSYAFGAIFVIVSNVFVDGSDVLKSHRKSAFELL